MAPEISAGLKTGSQPRAIGLRSRLVTLVEAASACGDQRETAGRNAFRRSTERVFAARNRKAAPGYPCGSVHRRSVWPLNARAIPAPSPVMSHAQLVTLRTARMQR